MKRTLKIVSVVWLMGLVLPYGLTEAAIDAGKRIKFQPAVKDGKPVSYWMELVYNFRL